MQTMRSHGAKKEEETIEGQGLKVDEKMLQLPMWK